VTIADDQTLAVLVTPLVVLVEKTQNELATRRAGIR